MTKDQLEALFRTEVERMSEHLDNLQFAARRIAGASLRHGPTFRKQIGLLKRGLCGPSSQKERLKVLRSS